MDNKSNPYNQLLLLGRKIRKARFQGKRLENWEILNAVQQIESGLKWRSVEEFLQLFPPIKRYADDGCWDYASTKEMIAEDLGDRFTGSDFKSLLLVRCFENQYLNEVSRGYVWAVSKTYNSQTGKDILTEFLEELAAKK